MLDNRLIKNITSLFSIRVATFIFPLITLPYLVRILGLEGYGSYAFSLAIIRYVVLIVNYGFDLTATRAVAGEKNIGIVSKVFWNVLSTRICLCLFCLPILVVLCEISTAMYEIKELIYLGYFSVCAMALYQQWLFQAKEELASVSIANIVFQFVNIPLVFIFIKSAEDLWIAAGLSIIPPLLMAVFSLIKIKNSGWIIWVRPSSIEIMNQLKTGWHIFISTAAVSLYTSSVTVILGFISGPSSVAIFVSAEKLLKAAQGLYSPISQSFYPRINNLIRESKDKAIGLIRYLIKLQTLITFCIFVMLYSFAPLIIKLMFGEDYLDSVNILRILAFVPVLTGWSNILGIQILLTHGYKKEFSKILVISGVVSLMLLLPLTKFYAETGAAVSVLFSEFFVTLYMIKVILNKKIPIFEK